MLFMVISTTAYVTRFNQNNRYSTTLNVTESTLDYFPVDSRTFNTYSEYVLVCFVIYYLWVTIQRITPSLGTQSRFKSLAQAPEMSMFSFTCVLILTCIPLRFLDWHLTEDIIVAIVMFTLPLKLLFFCRASRSVGSFVVMIYKILVNDVLCFVVFLIIFVIGFSQCKC